MPPMDHRPPLAVSPRRLRPRRNLRSVPSLQTTPVRTRTMPETPARSSLTCDQLISSELMEMAKKANNELIVQTDNLGTGLNASIGNKTCSFFERGRFYELYSARRNERLKMRQMAMEFDETVVQDPAIAVELAKMRNTKKAEGLRKSVPASFSVSKASSLRSSVRSSKEIKKIAVGGSRVKKSAADADVDVVRRIGTRSVRKIGR